VTAGGERPHKRLEVWQKAMALVEAIYGLTMEFPRSEVYGLSGQMRRSAISVPCNIAEGAARKTRSEFVQFLTIAQGSLSELDTQVELACRLGYVDEQRRAEASAEITTVFRMLSGLVRKVRGGNSE